MKTFAELKRDLQQGRKLKLVYHYFNNERTNKLLNIEREIVKVQSNGAYLQTLNKTGKSFLELPCASLTEYDGEHIKIYGHGNRPLSEQEQGILDNMPSKRPENKELVEQDMVSDGSTTFYMDKRYLEEQGANWYWTWDKGLYYDRNNNNMRDKKIKGNLELEYVLI